jgi:hypothetical protein
MTQRAGSLISQLIDAFVSSPKQGARSGSLDSFVSGGVAILYIYKNEGWYAAGSAWETWITSGAPQTVPPSGHTLAFEQHFPIEIAVGL